MGEAGRPAYFAAVLTASCPMGTEAEKAEGYRRQGRCANLRIREGVECEKFGEPVGREDR